MSFPAFPCDEYLQTLKEAGKARVDDHREEWMFTLLGIAVNALCMRYSMPALETVLEVKDMNDSAAFTGASLSLKAAGDASGYVVLVCDEPVLYLKKDRPGEVAILGERGASALLRGAMAVVNDRIEEQLILEKVNLQVAPPPFSKFDIALPSGQQLLPEPIQLKGQQAYASAWSGAKDGSAYVVQDGEVFQLTKDMFDHETWECLVIKRGSELDYIKWHNILVHDPVEGGVSPEFVLEKLQEVADSGFYWVLREVQMLGNAGGRHWLASIDQFEPESITPKPVRLLFPNSDSTLTGADEFAQNWGGRAVQGRAEDCFAAIPHQAMWQADV